MLPKLKHACEVIDKLKPTDATARHKGTAAPPVIDELTLSRARQDLIYALVLLDAKDATDVLHSYLTRDNGDDGFGGGPGDPMSNSADDVLRNIEIAKGAVNDDDPDD